MFSLKANNPNEKLLIEDIKLIVDSRITSKKIYYKYTFSIGGLYGAA